ncbi:hypothetical protein ACP275_06G160300 [Erythranthe tilingii]
MYSDDDLYCDDVDEEIEYSDEVLFSDNEDGPEVEEDDRGDADRRRRINYTTLTEESIRQLQDKDISEVCGLLSVSRGLACTLLRHYNWRPDSVSEKWFADEEKVRESVGLLPPGKSESKPLNPSHRCKICLEKIKGGKETLSSACGHPFCGDCWKNYVTFSINEGPGCLSLCCPEPGCKARVGPDMMDLLASEEEKEKYNRYLLRSYVELHGTIKWCPGPGCDRAVQIESGECKNYDVTCDCSYVFCWNCTEDMHRPVDCETVEKWVILKNSEAENTTWIMAYTKPCPKCKRSIEKNDGCNHMTCGKSCGHQFCWLCLGNWDNAHICNGYKDAACDKAVMGARKYLERYAHYYERWAGNHKSRGIALSCLDWARKELRDNLMNAVQNVEGVQMEFAVEAWEQIVECRRVLKWSYAYAYYLCCSEKAAKIAFFEFLQGQAELNLERLHHCAEKEMQAYAKGDCSLNEFVAFREKVVDLTSITKSYFEKLVTALENDLSEVTDTSIVSTSIIKSVEIGPLDYEDIYEDDQ